MIRSLDDCLVATQGRQSRPDNFLLLRIFAASLVVYGHAFALAAPDPMNRDFVSRYLGYRYSGDIAVAAFFILSGFMVMGSLERRADIREFLLARAVRLFPGLLGCLVVSAVLVGPLVSSLSAADYFSSALTWRYISSNFFLIGIRWDLPGVFEATRYGPVVNGSLWTLPIEARMYLYLAVVGLLPMQLPLRRVWLNLGLLTFVVWICSHASEFNPQGGIEAVRLMVFFTAGAAMFVNRRLIPVSGWIACCLCLNTWLCRETAAYELVFSGAMVYVIFWIAYGPVIKMPAWLGDISYGTYLYGWIIEQVLANYWPGMTPLWMAWIGLPIIWAVATLSWWGIEKPALALLKRRKSQKLMLA